MIEQLTDPHKKVLVVDDDEAVRMLVQDAVEGEYPGVKVRQARNGREGLDALLNNRDTDLVLVDGFMPEMDGFELVRRLRELDPNHHVRVVAFTASDRTQGFAGLVHDQLRKPFDVEELLGTVSRHLRIEDPLPFTRD